MTPEGEIDKMPVQNNNNSNKKNDGYYNIKTDRATERNGKVVNLGETGESATDTENHEQIQLARSISEIQPRNVSRFDESPVELRRQPGRVASLVPTSATSTPILNHSDYLSYLATEGRYNKKSKQQKNVKGMTLQLVLPLNGLNNNLSSENNSPVSYAEIPGNSYPNGRNRYHSSSIYSLPEYPDSEIHVDINNGFISKEKNFKQNRSPTTMSNFGSVRAHDAPTPTEEKRKAFSDVLTKTLCIFYALFNITLGFALHISDLSDDSYYGSEIFSLILVVIAFSYILYLTIDIHMYKKRREKFEQLLEEQRENGFNMEQTPDGHFQIDIVVPESMGKAIKHDYCFNKDKHSTNFFLKIGALAFCFGHLIHSALLFAYQLIFLSSTDDDFLACASVPTLIVDLVYPIYSFFLLYFIFKYSNVIINKRVTLARFGIIHCLSASICFWIWTIIRETAEAVNHKKTNKETDHYSPQNFLPGLFHRGGSQPLDQHANISLRRFTTVCEYDDESIKSIYQDISPYLYPFSVEFSILIVGIWYLIWQNIGICKAANEEEVTTTTQCNNPPGGDGSDYTESNVVVHADCQSSNKGLFGGLVVLVLTVVNCLLYFVCVYIRKNAEKGTDINVYTTMSITSIMFITCCIGYKQITKLDVNTGHINLHDEFLLFVCIPAYFLNGIFSLIPAIINGEVIRIIKNVLTVSQVLLQTVFILDGLRRSSNTRFLRKIKPGREIVTFLIIANIAMWLLQTFQVKTHEIKDDRYEFYGEELWTVLGHICLPLMMFYRFHSSVCLGDIWKFAYEPSGH